MSDAFAELRSALPDAAELERRWRGLTLLATILDPTPYPKYRYDPDLGGARVGVRDRWNGDLAYAVFTDEGAFLRIFDHESDVSPYALDRLCPGMVDGLPAVFAPFVESADLDDERGYPCITTAVWTTGDGWLAGDPQPGDDVALVDDSWIVDEALDPTGLASAWFDYGPAFTDEAAAPVLALEPLTTAQVLAVNPDTDLDLVRAVAAAVGVTVDGR